jgi:hypothetical protein
VKLERGQFIPWEEFRSFDMSLGQSEDEVASVLNQPKMCE